MSYLQIQRNRGKQGRQFAYVHLTRSVWNPAKRRSVQQRVYVGRLEASGERLRLSKGFGGRGGTVVALAELRRRLTAGEDVAAWLRAPAAGTGGAGGATTAVPAGVSIVGDAQVLLHLAEETGLTRVTREAFGAETGDVLLAVALHQAAEGQAVYLAGDWLEEREVPAGMRGARLQTDQVYARLAGAGADTVAQERFFRGWLAAAGKPAALIYDLTSISTYARDLELAEYGYNREGEDLPQINLALVCDARRGTPLWYRALPGSIPDVVTLKLTGDLLRDLGLSHFSYSLDRGFYSQANIRELLAAGLGFTIGVPFASRQAQDLLPRHRTALASPKCSFLFHDRVMRHVQDRWQIPGERGHRPCTLSAHLFFEPARQAALLTRLETGVFRLEAKAATQTFHRRRDAAAWLAENAGTLQRCLAIRPAGAHFRIARQPQAVALAAARLGYTLILSSRREARRDEVLACYRGRDRVEKLFDTLKNEDGQHRLRTGSDAAAAGRLLVAFLALVLRSELEARLRAADLLRKLSVPQCLAHLRQIKSVRSTNGQRHLLEITKRNRELLAALGVPLPQ